MIETFEDDLKLISERIGFIQERIEELDQTNFCWTKQSIMNIIIQINQPSHSFINQINTSMVSIPIPQELKHDEDQFTPTTLQRPLQLLSLPVEIIEQIIQFAHHFDNLERSEEIIKNSPHSSQSKINKSFISRISSISLVNRGLYQLSCPILWKNLRILGIGFIPLQFALHEIFPKYGQFLKSLKITLSARELKSLSFQNGLDNFQLLLSPILSQLDQLRHLRLESLNCSLNEQSIIPIISHLRLLESFHCIGLKDSGIQMGIETLGRLLSSLKNLSDLYFSNTLCVDQTWCHFSWPLKLNQIRFKWCPRLSPIDTWKLIHHLGKNVKRLDLDFIRSPFSEFSIQWRNSQIPNWNTIHQFSLPKLVDLRLGIDSLEDQNIILAFETCKSIQTITLDFSDGSIHYNILEKLIFKRKLPLLDTLILEYEEEDISDDHKERLQEICGHTGIRLFFDTDLEKPQIWPDEDFNIIHI